MDNPLQTLAPPTNRAFVFEHPKFGIIRGLTLGGKPYFVGNDAATALEYADPFAALKQHVPQKFKLVLTAKQFKEMVSNQDIDEKQGIFSNNVMGGAQRLTFISEAGLYKLILRSKMPAAEKFSDWVCEEVLPAIRESGIYTTPQMLAQFFESVANAETVDKCVYIHEMSNGRIKIGNAQDFLRRMRQIETGSGYTVVRSCRTDDLPEKEARKLERDCHSSFADDRILGEYFSTPFEKARDELNRLAKRNASRKLVAPPTK